LTVGRDNWIGPNTAIMKSTVDGAFYKTKNAERVEITAPQFFKIVE